MEDFNKETALNELLGMFKGCENVGFTEVLKITGKAMDKVEKIYLDGYQKGLEAGLKKIDINNGSN